MKVIRGLVTGQNLTFASKSGKPVINYCLILRPESGTSLPKLERLAKEMQNPKLDIIIILPSRKDGLSLVGNIPSSNGS